MLAFGIKFWNMWKESTSFAMKELLGNILAQYGGSAKYGGLLAQHICNENETSIEMICGLPPSRIGTIYICKIESDFGGIYIVQKLSLMASFSKSEK